MGIPLRYDIKIKETTVDYEFGNAFKPILNYLLLSATYNVYFYLYPRIFHRKESLFSTFPHCYTQILPLWALRVVVDTTSDQHTLLSLQQVLRLDRSW